MVIQKSFDEVGVFVIGGRRIKYIRDLVLLEKKKETLQSMLDRLVLTGRKCGMEIKIEESLETKAHTLICGKTMTKSLSVQAPRKSFDE